MRNDVHFPPAPGQTPAVPAADARPPASATYLNSRAPEPSHPHTADRAHSLEKTSDKPATGMIYDTPEDRGGIDSLTLSIIVVAVVAIALLVIAYLIFRTT